MEILSIHRISKSLEIQWTFYRNSMDILGNGLNCLNLCVNRSFLSHEWVLRTLGGVDSIQCIGHNVGIAMSELPQFVCGVFVTEAAPAIQQGLVNDSKCTSWETLDITLDSFGCSLEMTTSLVWVLSHYINGTLRIVDGSWMKIDRYY